MTEPALYRSGRKPSRISGLALIAAGFCLLFIALGSWQLQRRAEKQTILSLADARSQEVLLQLPDARAFDEYRYTGIQLVVQYLPERQFLLDNQVRGGRAGFNVLTPAQLANDERLVLVDRGWMPMPADRQPTANFRIDALTQEIAGYLYTPFGEGMRLGPVDNNRLDWPRLIQYLDFEQLSQRLDTPLTPVVIRLAEDQDDGFRREWPVVGVSPDRHLAYAVQWYGLAVAGGVIFLLLLRVKK